MEFVLKQIFFCLCFSIIKGFILLKAKLGASVDACFFSLFLNVLKGFILCLLFMLFCAYYQGESGLDGLPGLPGPPVSRRIFSD